MNETTALPLSFHDNDRTEATRIVEALLFASARPLDQKELSGQIPENVDIAGILGDLQQFYFGRGVHLVRLAGGWAFRTAPDLHLCLEHHFIQPKKLSQAAMETLAIIAYHQPATRAEIEEIRGVSTSKGSLDLLMEIGWVRLRGRRKTPGRPVQYGTTPEFLDHFNLARIDELPGIEELKGLGLLENAFAAPVEKSFEKDE